MYEEKKMELRLRALEARTDAQDELLTTLARAVIDGSPGGGALRQALLSATAYEGPSNVQKAIAKLAATAIGRPL